MAFDPKIEETLEGPIQTLGEYRPWGWHKEMGGDGSNYPTHSGKILDLKGNQAGGINYFFDYLVGKITGPVAIAAVPSSNAAKGPTSGVHLLADRLCAHLGLTNAGACLVRHTSITKKAAGGDRSIGVDLNSIRVEDEHLVKDSIVLLLDDVTTSGNSLLACRRLLLGAGAKEVQMLALGRTSR